MDKKVLDTINENLKGYGASISLALDTENSGAYSVHVNWDEKSEVFATEVPYENLTVVVNDAWVHARAKAKQMEKPKYTQKIYVIEWEMMDGIDKDFDELTDAEILALCEKDEDMEYHDIFYTLDGLAGAWNAEEIFSPSCSYMRIINVKE